MSSSGSIDHGRFSPGDIVAGRYRVIGRLGKGGMGEVYRADDLRLGQAVALKFLPGALERDPIKLGQFHSEVRLARQVSHPNVCRVYDIGEAAGVPFISMEYVDGEDLASLLRRIGRLPQDKGIEIGRQLCAGLAAAHARGVLHRDLKPANVMLDGEGKVRLTDFGLAAATGTIDSSRAGTPAYMAPEQLGGREASVQSDLFALGLVLYEIFTGRRAYQATSVGELIQQQQDGTFTRPAVVVPDLDPSVERVIVRCLQHAPEDRPASALAVAAGLPGGDPLAAALAAGETPSPQMVAAAGEAEGLGAAKGIAAGAAVLALVLTTATLCASHGLVNQIPIIKPPDVLADRAQQMLQAFGYTDPPADTARGFSVNSDYLRYLRRPEAATLRRTAYTARPNGLNFYYRTSPRQLIPVGNTNDVDASNPPVRVSGMTVVTLDSQGRLLAFDAMPDQIDPGGAARSPRWDVLLQAAGIDQTRFAAVSPERTPLTYADTRSAWRGELPDRPGAPIRVEAAAYRGRPVYFEVIGPWSRAARQQERERSSSEVSVSAVVTTTFVCLLVMATLIARYNLRVNRSDRRAASRIASVFGAVTIIGWAVGATHVADGQSEVGRFFGALGESLFVAGLAFVLYVALEPWVRRFWPNSLKGWTRLVSGHVNDARVSRDVLLGAAAGALTQLIGQLREPFYHLLGHELPIANAGDVHLLDGMRHALGSYAALSFDATFNGMFCVFFIVAMKVVLRRMGFAVLATAAFYALVTVPSTLRDGSYPPVDVTLAAISMVPLLAVTFRYGLLASCVTFFFAFVLSATPWSTKLSEWQSGVSLFALTLLTAIIAWATWAATARGSDISAAQSQRRVA
jgi:serine/threonine-protein kinase